MGPGPGIHYIRGSFFLHRGVDLVEFVNFIVVCQFRCLYNRRQLLASLRIWAPNGQAKVHLHILLGVLLKLYSSTSANATLALGGFLRLAHLLGEASGCSPSLPGKKGGFPSLLPCPVERPSSCRRELPTRVIGSGSGEPAVRLPPYWGPRSEFVQVGDLGVFCD